MCNRYKGNSANFVQGLASAEGCAETRGNEELSLLNKKYPLKRYLQGVTHDSYQMVSAWVDGDIHRHVLNEDDDRVDKKYIPSNCTCHLILPYPKLGPCAPRELEVEHFPTSINERDVSFDVQPRNEAGLPPKVKIATSQNQIKLRFVHSMDDSELIIGYQVYSSGVNVSTLRFNDPLHLRGKKISDINVASQQVIGFPANDGKQVLILTGQCYSSVLCSCPCCMREKKHKGVHPEWWQKMHQYKTGVCVPVIPDAPLREGKLSFESTAKEYQRETGSGLFGLTGAEARKINLDTGSSFLPELLNVPNQKQTHGPMHLGAGCTTHCTQAEYDAISKKEETLPWWKSVLKLKEVVKGEIATIKNSNEYQQHRNEDKNIGKRRRVVTNELERRNAENPADTATNEALQSRSEELLQTRSDHAKTSSYGIMLMRLQGLMKLLDLLNKYAKPDSKRPKGQASWGLLKALEKDGRGKFMAHFSGLEMTNRAGMTAMENFDKVSNRVKNMYATDPNSTTPPSPQDLEMHRWLNEKFSKYERVSKKLFELLTFLKSQEKKSAEECREVIYQFSLAFDDAFPDKDAFNKLHFLICHTPTFVELWGMLGVVNEESFESFHSRLARVKDLLKHIPGDQHRVEVINARMQCLLKKDVMDGTMKVEAATTGIKTGPQTRKRKVVSNASEHILDKFEEKTIDGVEFIELPCGALMRKEWMDIYLWFSSRKAPQSWIDAFNASSPFDSEAQRASTLFSTF